MNKSAKTQKSSVAAFKQPLNPRIIQDLVSKVHQKDLNQLLSSMPKETWPKDRDEQVVMSSLDNTIFSWPFYTYPKSRAKGRNKVGVVHTNQLDLKQECTPEV